MRRWYVWVPISVLLLGFVIARTRPWEMAALGDRLQVTPLVFALLLNLLVVVLWAVRSLLLMAGVGHPVSFLQLVPVVSFANTINNVTPASSGEVLRAIVLKDRHAVPYSRSAAVIVLERFWALGVMAVTALAAAAVVFLDPAPPGAILAWGAALAAMHVPPAAYRLGLRPGRLLRRFEAAPPEDGRALIGRTVGGLVELDSTLAGLLRDPRQTAGFLATTAAIFVCYALQLVLVVSALGDSIPLQAAWAALGLGILAGVFSALPFGLGATDVVVAVLLERAGLAAPEAGAAILLLRAVTTLPLGVAGSVSWAFLAGTRALPSSASQNESP